MPVVKVQNKDIVIGSIAQFDEERTARFLFDVEGKRVFSFRMASFISVDRFRYR